MAIMQLNDKINNAVKEKKSSTAIYLDQCAFELHILELTISKDDESFPNRELNINCCCNSNNGYDGYDHNQ